MEINVTAAIGRDHYRTVLQAGKNTVIGDEPIDKGGTDEGMNPFEILAAALGCCTCTTVRMYADRKEWKLESIHVTLHLSRDEEKNVTNITRDIEFLGDLSAEERERLLAIANKCPVHKVLSNPINIQTTLKS